MSRSNTDGRGQYIGLILNSTKFKGQVGLEAI